MPKEGQIHNDYILPMCSDIYLCVFLCSTLGIKNKALFAVFISPGFTSVLLSLVITRCISAKMQHLDVASMVV